MFVCLSVCVLACFIRFRVFGAGGRQVCVLVVSVEVCGAELCLVSRLVRGWVCSFVFLVCASFVGGASVVVWGNYVLRRHAFSRGCRFWCVVVYLWSALFVVVGFGGSWRVWFVCVRVHLGAARCVGRLRAHTSSTSPPRGNKVDGLRRAASDP